MQKNKIKKIIKKYDAGDVEEGARVRKDELREDQPGVVACRWGGMYVLHTRTDKSTTANDVSFKIMALLYFLPRD